MGLVLGPNGKLRQVRRTRSLNTRMARIDPSLHLSQSEIDELMASESRCRIATISSGSDINLTPMTFGWAGGAVYIFGRGQKVANLRRNDVATILVDVGDAWNELKGIMMRGTARVLESRDAEIQDEHLAHAQRNLGYKQGLVKNGELAPYSATASGNSRRWIVFRPKSVVSWNNENLGTQSDT